MTTHELSKTNSAVPARSEETRAAGRVLIPSVDIFETEENLTLMVDMPGVDKEGLSINLEKGVLTLDGRVSSSLPGKVLSREFSSINYHRQFKLSEQINGDKSSAEFRNGVLTLVIPKAEAAKPKRIDIKFH